jgi:hypothetical protein
VVDERTRRLILRENAETFLGPNAVNGMVSKEKLA